MKNNKNASKVQHDQLFDKQNIFLKCNNLSDLRMSKLQKVVNKHYQIALMVKMAKMSRGTYFFGASLILC